MDAVIPVEKLIQTAADWNWKAVAITDHGVIQAFPNAAQTAEKLAKAGKQVKIIYGMEGYLIGDDTKQKFANHVIILAKNKVGLENLYKLVSISQIKFMHYRPRIPKTLLAELRDGLIIGSACEAGELIRAIVAGRDDAELEEIANFYDYLEIQPIHNNDFLVRSEDFPNITTDEDLRDINRKVVALAKKLGKPIVATTDAHFLNPDRHHCLRSVYAYVCAKLCESYRIRSHYSAVIDVAAYRDILAFKRVETLIHRQHIEKRLCRMLIHTVAGVDDRSLKFVCDRMRCT